MTILLISDWSPRFLQRHTKFISVLVGGYPSFHPTDSSKAAAKTAAKDSEQDTAEAASDPSPNKLDTIKTSLKQKSANLKDSLINYIYNPSNGQPPPEPKHIDFTKRGSKLYKNTGDVFCLEDEEEDAATVQELQEVAAQPGTVHLAPCQRVDETGLLSPCHLLVTTTHLCVLLPGARYTADMMTDGKYANISILYVRTYLHLLLVESTYLGIVKHRLHV